MLDDRTALHMKEWIDAHVAEDSRDTAINAMLAFLDDYPDLVETRSWTEIHALAMREVHAPSGREGSR